MAFQKNGENLIYTAHGLLAVTSDSGVFSPHQLILFSASFSLRQKVKKKIFLAGGVPGLMTPTVGHGRPGNFDVI